MGEKGGDSNIDQSRGVEPKNINTTLLTLHKRYMLFSSAMYSGLFY